MLPRRNNNNNYYYSRRSLLAIVVCTFLACFNYWEEIHQWYSTTSSSSSSLVLGSSMIKKNKSATSNTTTTGNSSSSGGGGGGGNDCFNDTKTPWHISRNEKFTCTNNREFPSSLITKKLSLLSHKGDADNEKWGEESSSFFFKSCQECCQSMFPNLAVLLNTTTTTTTRMDCHCKNVCGHYHPDNYHKNRNSSVDNDVGGTTATIATTATRCTFCEQGIVNLNLLVPGTNGQTCGKIRLMVLNKPTEIINGSDVCVTIQKEERVCCPKGLSQEEELARLVTNNDTMDPNNVSNGGDAAAAVIVKVDYKKDSNAILRPKRNNTIIMRHDENGTFVGANVWYRYWTMTKRNNRNVIINNKYNNNNNNNNHKSDSSSSQSSTNTIDHSHDNYVLSQVKALSMKALEYTLKMKSRYDEVNAIPDYRARGLGWIQHRLGMILTVVVAGDVAAAEDDVVGKKDDKSAVDDEETTAIVLSAGNVSIFIVDTVGDMKCGGGNNNNTGEIPENWMDYHPPLTMWVRANGPEIFAGTALPHVFALSSSSPSSSPNDDDDGSRHRCAWRYDFQAQTPGVYSIYIKALTFNGFADWQKDLCKTKPISWEKIPTEDNNINNDQMTQAAIVRELAEKVNFSHHRGLMAFKNYDKIPTCCEACTRTSGCRMWSIPGEIDECELFFDKVEDDIDFWDSDVGKYLGRDRQYSYVKQDVSNFPVVRRRLGRNDDHRSRKLAVNRNEIDLSKWPGLQVPDSYGYPRDEPALDFIGCGWSCLKSFESPCHYPSDDLIFGSGKRIEIITAGSSDQVHNASIASKVEEKRACSVEDESFGNGRWVKYPFPDDSECMPVERDLDNGGYETYMPNYNGTSMPPYCWHRDYIDQCCNKCFEGGCTFIVNHRWVSDLRRDGKWFGRWENYDCYYKDMGSDEIQQCIDKKNISRIELKGASVKDILDSYIKQKLKGIQMAEPTASSRKIFLDTLKMPHVVWHNSVQEFGNELDAYEVIDNETSEYYFVTGFYYSSEREPHVTVDRSLQFSKLAWEKLTPKGYKMINGFDVTAAFTFDSDGQNDGLHITGPPIRAILTKFFHHLCQE